MKQAGPRRAPVWVVALAVWVLAGIGAATEPGVRSDPDGATAPPQEGGQAVPDPDARRGAIIPVDTAISDVTTESIKRRVEKARELGATVIIFEMNTPGGMVTSALDICDYIKGLTDLKTVAWVHTQAFSAGSLLSVACNEIVMSSASTIGDCGVILGGPTGAQEVPEALRAKAEAPVLAQFRESATRRGYPRLLCEAMVIKEREVWWVENTKTGERKFVRTKEKVRLLGEAEEEDEPPRLLVPSPWKLVETYWDPVVKTEVEIDQPIVDSAALLTMSQSEAYGFGFCKAIVDREPELVARYGLLGDLPRIAFTWSERFTGWLTSMPVRMFLLVIILLGAYVEFNTPGVGVPGLVALIALAIFVGAPYLTGLANIWEIVVILIGAALLLVEIFVVPGFGIFGVGGLVCILVGLLATFVPEEPGRRLPFYWPTMEAGWKGLKMGVYTLAAGLGGSAVGALLISKYIGKIPIIKWAAPANPTPSQVATDDPYRGAARVGDIGLAETPLHPAGRARFGATLVDVVTEGDWIDKGTEVEVIEHRGNHVVVRKVGN